LPLTLRITLLSCVLTLPLLAQDAAEKQQPPTQTTPPPTQTDQQPPPTQPPTQVEPTPPIPKPTVTLPAPRTAPAQSTERDTGGDAWSIEPMYWLAHQAPTIRQGHKNQASIPGDLGFPGANSYALGVAITVPTGHENSLEFSGFQAKGHGSNLLGVSQAFFGNLYAKGDTLLTSYNMRTFKVSWNYLTFPFPSAGAKFRFKTLYELRYTSFNTYYAAPADINAAPVAGYKSNIRPSLGVGIEYHPAPHVRFEMKASGFALPHSGEIYDGEASLVAHTRHVELLAGARIFHIRTSPKDDAYFTQTLWGPYGGVRLIWK
jgi:hypothetical protein